MPTGIRAGDCYTCQMLGVGTTAVYLATGNYLIATGCARAGMVARYIMFSPETDDVRFHITGPTPVSPAAGCGMVLAAGDYLMLDSIQQIQNFRAINTTAGHSSTAAIFFYF